VKKTTLTFTLFIITMAIFFSISFCIRNVKGADAADYSIEHVNHTVEVLYNGYVQINDTLRISVTGQAPEDFLIGFPYEYGPHVLRCIAYNESDVFPVNLDVPLENHVGFYGVKVNFPQGSPQVFTVLFVLSNNLLIHNGTAYYFLNFPAFPSLTKPADVCNVSIVLPENASYVTGTVNAFNYSEVNFPAFTYNSSQITFSVADDKILVADLEELVREIRLNEFGEIEGSDTYRLTNRAELELNFIDITLPPNASNPRAQDQFRRKMADPAPIDEETNRYRIALKLSLKNGESALFSVRYNLQVSTSQKNEGESTLNFSFFQHLNCYIDQVLVIFVLPEGAKIQSFEDGLIGDDYILARNVFQELVTIKKQGIISFDTFNVALTYEYNSLWLSFRPTLWAWSLSIVGCAIAIVWKRPKAPLTRVTAPTVAVSLRPEHVKSFVDEYQQKTKIVLEIESLVARVRKGKIPRRRYKVQRKTLETRLGSLSRSLAESGEKMRAAGGLYADLMRQLEIAETEINEVEANIKSIEARHSRGDLSLEAYRKLLADYQRRKEKAQTTINGILLRLREETH